jgi:hypothetical protein
MLTRRLACLSAFAFSVTNLDVGHARAGTFPPPTNRPVLSVNGRITMTNREDSAVFDIGMLEAMPQVTFQTNTPWFVGPMTFQGVPMTEMMRAVGGTGHRLKVYSLNDYETEIPVEDFAKYGPILAFKRNGRYMTYAEKGPLFIVYPYDSRPELRTQQFYTRSPWQIARIEVRE